jgi:IclR family acetate operon transcriptional repressor
MDQLTTVEKAIDILFHLHAASEPQGVSDIGRSLGMPKSSAHRLLAALGRRGLVDRSERGRYRPGTALIALGLGALDREPIVALAREVLETTSAQLGETIFLVSAQSRELIVLDKAEGTGFLRVSPKVGERVPVHATAVGKLYLAYSPESVAVETSPTSFTQQTRTSADELAAVVETVRDQGFATNDEEWVPGLGVVAAPVFFRNRLVAAVALGAASARLAVMGSDSVTRNVLAAAARIGARLSVDPLEYAPASSEHQR